MKILRSATLVLAGMGLAGIAAAAGVYQEPGAGSNSPQPTTPSSVEVPGFIELVGAGREQLLYQQGQALALAWLANPGELDGPLRTLAGVAGERLARARFQVAANAQGDEYCARVAASLFVVQTIPDTIFVCADTRWHVQHEAGPAATILAQGFLHEAVHLAGITDECQATRLEISVARNNIESVNLGNLKRYAGQCEGLLDSGRRASRRIIFVAQRTGSMTRFRHTTKSRNSCGSM